VRHWRPLVIIAVLFAAIIAISFLRPIPQDPAYHNFADQRTLLRIPHCLDVLSNIPFLMVGVWGMFAVGLRGSSKKIRFIDPRERWPYLVFFAGVALTALGSSYYHLQPENARLVWDRLPMTIGFMALVAAVLCERVSVKGGLTLLAPMIAAGIFSVVYWRLTENEGRGDLRPYALVQFGALLAILLLIAVYPARYTRGSDFIISLGIYGVAKGFEAADRQIFALGHVVSGHTLKHLTAALSAFWILYMLEARGAPEQVAKHPR
jgi:hypothetical protein